MIQDSPAAHKNYTLSFYILQKEIANLRPLLTVDPNQNPKTFFGLVLVLVN